MPVFKNDSKGNILQYTGKNGIVNSILWGYHRLYPVAQVVGETYETAKAQLTVTYDQFQELAETDLLIQINHIRTNLAEARRDLNGLGTKDYDDIHKEPVNFDFLRTLDF